MKARVSNLIKTEAEWLKIDFIPLAGELVVYAPDSANKYPRLKIGDGVNSLHLLPFIVESVTDKILSDYQQATRADGGRITDYIK